MKIMYLLVAIAIMIGVIGIWLRPRPVEAPVMPGGENQGTLCTMDAMQCPDGSYVGRTGPNCEFVCPPVATSSQSIIATSSYADLIVVTVPTVDSVLGSTTIITGNARGNWYFEASFPIELRDRNGVVLAQTHATANGDWMTTEFVPFTAQLDFANPTHLSAGVLRLKNDNPSGQPENDTYVDIPVRFAP